MKLNSLEDLFIHEHKDLYSAETQLVKALGRAHPRHAGRRAKQFRRAQQVATDVQQHGRHVGIACVRLLRQQIIETLSAQQRRDLRDSLPGFLQHADVRGA